MLNYNILQNFELLEPLPVAAIEAAHTGIFNRGFSRNAVLEDYAFTSIEKGRSFKTNIIAFTHPIHRNPEYAGFTVFNAVNDYSDVAIVSTLAKSSAPFHLIHHNDKFSFWASAVDNNGPKPILIEDYISYEQLDYVLGKYEVDLKPQRIIDVKQGRDTFTLPIFHSIQPLQLSLWAADVTRNLLVEHFAQTVEGLRDYARKRPDIGIYDSSITSLSIQLLGAIILSDTGVLGKDARLTSISLNQLVTQAHEQFPTYFEESLFAQYHEAAEDAYETLRQVCYAGFVPDMLTEIYRRAYGVEQRKQQGRFDTPLYLTRQIWENIPVEYLPPDQRVIADMTCGWGSFLIAGHERLSNLTDTQTSLLREHLRGNDIDLFTAKLAGLGLLLATSEDSWFIDHQNALEWNWLHTSQPNIIVGNLPFSGSRKESSNDAQEDAEDEKKRNETANSFLEIAIKRLAPNGYLAMIMPRSFTSAEASPDLRQFLLETCDVLELWEMPKDVFSGPTQRTIVVFARKKAEFRGLSHEPVRVRTVQPGTHEDFKSSGAFTASAVVADQSIWNEEARKSKNSKNTHLIVYKVILPEYTWKMIRSYCVDMFDRATTIRGAIVGKKSENKRWMDFENPKIVPWLTGVKDVTPRPYFIDYKKATTIIYPNDLEEPRKSDNPTKDKEALLAGEKVLISYDPDPSWGQRVNVAIERRGYYVSDSFWIAVPRLSAQLMHISHEVLAAVLSWDVSNAWVIEFLRGPSIPKRALDTIPFPANLSQSDCQALKESMLQLEEEAKENRYESQKVKEANLTIDNVLKAAYHLDETTFERLRKVREWSSKTLSTLDILPNRDQANWSTSGVVDHVDKEQGTITLWIDGFDELQTVQIATAMPGWMLRTGAAFLTKFPRKYVKQGSIDFSSVDWDMLRPQPYMYMSEEELLGELTNAFQ